MIFQAVFIGFMIILTGIFVYHDSERIAHPTETAKTLTPSVFVAILAAMISTSSLIVAYQQALTAQLNYMAASRPWMGIDDLYLDGDLLRGSDRNWNIKIKGLVHNYGHSPATNVKFGAKIYFRHNATGREIFLPQEVSAERTFCQEMTTNPDQPFALGQTVFPAKSEPEGQVVYGSTSEEKEAMQSFKKLPPVFRTFSFEPWIIGCVTYVGLDKHDTFSTPFIMEIGRHSPTDRSVVVALDGGHDYYSQKDLVAGLSSIADPPS